MPVPEHRVGGRKRAAARKSRTTELMKPLRVCPFIRNRVLSGGYMEPFTHGVLPMGCPPPTLTSTFAGGTSAVDSVNRTWRL